MVEEEMIEEEFEFEQEDSREEAEEEAVHDSPSACSGSFLHRELLFKVDSVKVRVAV